jgi:phage tail protein X
MPPAARTMRLMALLFIVAALVASPPNVAKLLLAPPQVGSGYVVLQPRDGVGVGGNVTMDLCGRTGYPSERLRVARQQVDYLSRTTTLRLSNEVVAYKTGGAAQAMAEALRHARTCPSTPIKSDPALPALRFTLTRLTGAKLLKGYLFYRVRVRGTVKGKQVDETSYAVYQRLGDILSGTYSAGPNTAAQQQFVLHAAQQSALNLRHGKTATGPTA